MDYLCAYVWQQEESGSSLVLKHLVFHQGKMSVVLGCLAQGEEKVDFFVESVTDWFHEHGIGAFQREEGIKEFEVFWQKQLARKAEELEGVAILLCVGENFIILAKGNIKIWLLNNRFGRGHHRELSSQMGQANGLICKGSLESGIGILIADEVFFKGLSEQEIMDCLNPEILKEQVKVQKHLSEVAQVAGKSGKHPAAMLIVTC